jgi:hypothetical protein
MVPSVPVVPKRNGGLSGEGRTPIVLAPNEVPRHSATLRFNLFILEPSAGFEPAPSALGLRCLIHFGFEGVYNRSMTIRTGRKSPRALRFADIEVGDELQRQWSHARMGYYVVTDRWFDPVAGQNDPISGQMVAVVMAGRNRKESHTLRGLASNGFYYSDRAGLRQMAKKALKRNGADDEDRTRQLLP